MLSRNKDGIKVKMLRFSLLPNRWWNRDRVWDTELPYIHYAFSMCASLMATYLLFGNSVYQPDFDFLAYFRASHIIFIDPDKLYDVSAYPVHSHIVHFLPYINPPTFLLILCPLAFFSYPVAYGIWMMFNIAVSILLIKKIRALSELIGIQKYKNLFGSLTMGLPLWVNILLQGQASIVITAAITIFLLYLQNRQEKFGAFWFSVALCIKPHLFLPLLCFFAGYRRYRLLAYIFLWTLFFTWLSILLVGYHAWVDFFLQIAALNAHLTERAAACVYMINLRGVFSYFLGLRYETLITYVSFLGYSLIMLASWLIGNYGSTRLVLCQETLPLALSLSFFFSPWLHVQDCYVLLPVTIFVLTSLAELEREVLLLPVYIFAFPISLLIPMAWANRLLLIVFVCVSGYNVWSCRPVSVNTATT
ncbi:MAG TPA: glycosyltransferase family 87 protein [Ktedonosporobacter sp.]|nr:glycosyltransferase family 87 protein [Ktedonosporobacter sp.]